MHRFYVDSAGIEPFRPGAYIQLPEHISHQIRNVLRVTASDRVALFTGDGNEWVAEVEYPPIQGSRRSRVQARLVDCQTPDVEMRTKVAMAMALTRSQRYELALAKCAELGACEFVPIVSERVQKADTNVSSKRKARWDRIVSEAAELSGRVMVPEIASPMLMSSALSRFASKEVRVVLLWEGTSEPMLFDLLSSFRAEKEHQFNLALILGPVGGFSDDEARVAAEQGAILASLGTRVLRTETAAITSMALAAQVLG